MTSTMSTDEVCAAESRTSCISRPIRRESRSASSASRPTSGSCNTTRTSTSERSSSLPVAVEPNSTASLTLGSVRSAARSARKSSQWPRRYASSRQSLDKGREQLAYNAQARYGQAASFVITVQEYEACRDFRGRLAELGAERVAARAQGHGQLELRRGTL